MPSNSSGRGKVGQVNLGQDSGLPPAPGPNDLSQIEDSFYMWRKVLPEAAAARVVDYSELTATGRQAALSLLNEAKVQLEVRDGRTVVTARPGLFARLFALG